MTTGLDALALQLQAMTPQQRRQITALGTQDERSDILKQQLQQAIQAGQQDPGAHSSPWGAALGGLGSVLGGINSVRMQNNAQAGLQGVLDTKDAGRGGFQDLILQALLNRQKQAGAAITSPMGGVIAPNPFGGGM